MEKHIAKITQQVFAIRYYFGHDYRYLFDEPRVYKGETYKKDRVLWEGELDYPVLKENEKLKIENLNKPFTIKDVMRSTDGGYTYAVKEKELVEDDETEDSRKLALQQEKEHNEKSSWWKRIFG